MCLVCDNGHNGYSWAKLSQVTSVTVTKSGEKLRHLINCNGIACFENLAITVTTSDGKTFSSNVNIAVMRQPGVNLSGQSRLSV